jgi:hypothetical protein
MSWRRSLSFGQLSRASAASSSPTLCSVSAIDRRELAQVAAQTRSETNELYAHS